MLTFYQHNCPLCYLGFARKLDEFNYETQLSNLDDETMMERQKTLEELQELGLSSRDLYGDYFKPKKLQTLCSICNNRLEIPGENYCDYCKNVLKSKKKDKKDKKDKRSPPKKEIRYTCRVCGALLSSKEKSRPTNPDLCDSCNSKKHLITKEKEQDKDKDNEKEKGWVGKIYSRDYNEKDKTIVSLKRDGNLLYELEIDPRATRNISNVMLDHFQKDDIGVISLKKKKSC